MQITDPIADLLTRIRNASTAKHPSVDVPASNLKKAVCQILVDEGYIKSVQSIEDNKQGTLRLTLKYQENGAPQGHPEFQDPPGRPAARFQARPAHLHQLRRHAQGHEGPGHRDHFHLAGRYDRQGRSCRPRGRRSARLCVVRKGQKDNVENWKKTHRHSCGRRSYHKG